MYHTNFDIGEDNIINITVVSTSPLHPDVEVNYDSGSVSVQPADGVKYILVDYVR